MPYVPPPSSGGVTDGDKGDITVSGSGATWTIDSVINSSKMTATGWGETKYLRGDDTWQTIAGGGDVVGPASSTDRAIAIFNGTDGKAIQNSTPTISANGEVLLAAGGTADAPLKFQSGTNLTSAEAGAIEYDGKVHYGTHQDGSRGVLSEEQIITLTSAYTIPTAGPGLRQMFNAPAGGAVTLKSNTTYMFECIGALTSLSATSGTYSFGFLGTASTPSLRYLSIGNKGAVTAVAAVMANVTTSSSTALVAANTTTTGQFSLRGKVVVETGGTLIPAIGNSVEALPIVGINSTFRIWPVGAQAVQSVGGWA